MKKTILRLSTIAFLVLLQLFGGVANAEESQASKPNIIFIMADDLGKSLLPVYEKKSTLKMPNLGRLAKEGVIFNNAYATHVCFPTRAELVSGRYSLNTGAYYNVSHNSRHRKVGKGRTTGFYKYFYNGDSSIVPFIDPQYTPSFALPLQQADYQTLVVGKWHLNHPVKQPIFLASTDLISG